MRYPNSLKKKASTVFSAGSEVVTQMEFGASEEDVLKTLKKAIPDSISYVQLQQLFSSSHLQAHLGEYSRKCEFLQEFEQEYSLGDYAKK